MFDYTDKTVFVSGGTSGINLGIALAFADAGANVFVMSRKRDRVDAAISALSAKGVKAAGASADVRDPDAVKEAFEDCGSRFGAIHVVVSGAAGNFPAFAENISSKGFRAVIEIDLLGTHHVMLAALPHLARPGASIINISAPQAFIAMSLQAHVCAAKAGVDMITRTLALEWGPKGIRVNSVVPGPIEDTEGMARLAPGEEALKRVVKMVPLGRLGKKQDVANLCLFLGSDMAAYISGTVIAADGGWSLNMAGRMLEGAVARAGAG